MTIQRNHTRGAFRQHFRKAPLVWCLSLEGIELVQPIGQTAKGERRRYQGGKTGGIRDPVCAVQAGIKNLGLVCNAVVQGLVPADIGVRENHCLPDSAAFVNHNPVSQDRIGADSGIFPDPGMIP